MLEPAAKKCSAAEPLQSLVVTLLGRKRGHWLTNPVENEDAAWQQERLPEIPQNLGLPVCRGKRSSIVDSSLAEISHEETLILNFISRSIVSCHGKERRYICQNYF